MKNFKINISLLFIGLLKIPKGAWLIGPGSLTARSAAARCRYFVRKQIRERFKGAVDLQLG
jgi:hypothetical protein